jgi:hypothetical protein
VPAKTEASPTIEAIKASGTKKRVAELPALKTTTIVIMRTHDVSQVSQEEKLHKKSLTTTQCRLLRVSFH